MPERVYTVGELLYRADHTVVHRARSEGGDEVIVRLPRVRGDATAAGIIADLVTCRARLAPSASSPARSSRRGVVGTS